MKYRFLFSILFFCFTQLILSQSRSIILVNISDQFSVFFGATIRIEGFSEENDWIKELSKEKNIRNKKYEEKFLIEIELEKNIQ